MGSRCSLLIGDGCDGAVDFGQVDGELFGVGSGLVLEQAEGDGFSEVDRRAGVAAPVNAGVNSVAEGDIVGELVQLAVDGELGSSGPV